MDMLILILENVRILIRFLGWGCWGEIVCWDRIGIVGFGERKFGVGCWVCIFIIYF